MKKINRVFALLMAVIAVLCCGVCHCFAGTMPSFIGDVDLNNKVESTDATLIQRQLAGLAQFSKRQTFIGDVDHNGTIDVVDATLIQRNLAKMSRGFYTDYVFDTYPAVKNFCADYASGMAMPGVPVTFSVTGDGYAPLSYSFDIDAETVQERSADNSFTFTFPAAGRYMVKATVFNGFDESRSYTEEYIVTEPYDTTAPVVTAVHFDHLYNRYSSHTVTAHATGGVAPYQYCYTISGKSNEVRYEASKLGDFHEDASAAAGEFQLTTGYVDTDTIDTPYNALDTIISDDYYSFYSGDGSEYATLTLTVTVKDADGAESAPYMMTFTNTDIPE